MQWCVHQVGWTEVKLDFLQRLPWALAGLAHADTAKAQACAARLLQEFDACSPAEQLLRHCQTLLFLHADSLVRMQLLRWLAGTSLSQLPLPEYHISLYRFILVSERYIEGSHSLVKRGVSSHSSASDFLGAAVATATRGIGFEARLFENLG